METTVYAGRIKDPRALIKSSSGGAFTVLSDLFLRNGYPVIASVYNYDTNQQEFCFLETIEVRNSARGSKYVQSFPGNIFGDAYEWCQENPLKQLLFVGTGCQADGFRRFAELKGIRKQVVIVDIICHGVPSPKLWKEYVSALGDMSYVSFKDKRNGWNNPTAYAMVDGKEISLDRYVKVFYNHCNLRPSCYECPYATTERLSDITIGDYWGIENKIPDFYDVNGNSLFLVHTPVGNQLFDTIKDSIDYKAISVEDCLQPNLIQPTSKTRYRKKFWNDYKKRGAMYVINKYGDINYQLGIKNKIKALLRHN